MFKIIRFYISYKMQKISIKIMSANLIYGQVSFYMISCCVSSL